MKKLLYLSFLALSVFSCQKNEPDDLFGKSASERFEEKQNELRAALTAPEQGWKLTYFTKEGTYGGYHFLMKFTPEGLVTMSSDFSTTTSPTTSKYEIQEGQGTMLTFSTKNYIHELADAVKGQRGKGYQGEFEFIYYGKEENKLKFKTQRRAAEQFIYFEPATAEDWADIQTLSNNINTLIGNGRNYYAKATVNGTDIDYSLNVEYGHIAVAPLSARNNVSKSSIVATKTGIAFKSALTIQGKTFTALERDDNTTPPTYKATVEGVTVTLYYDVFPPDNYVSDDYQDIGTRVSALLYLADPLASYSSPLFVNNFIKIDNNKSFSRIYFVFGRGNKCNVELLYKFPSKNGLSKRVFVYDYALRNKRLYLSNPQLSTTETTDSDLWSATENATILRGANTVVRNITAAATEGFYVERTNAQIKYSNRIYLLKSRSTPGVSFPIYAQ